MELNNINNKGAWSEIAAALNQNFLKILAELLKYQHVTAISGANFLGYFTSSSVLPNPAEAAWAIAGDLKAVTVYAYYTSDAVPSGFSAGWNALSSLGTYDFTDYSSLLTKVSELDNEIETLKNTPNIEVVNNLTEGGAEKALSAEMGKQLNETLSQFGTAIEEVLSNDDFVLNPGYLASTSVGQAANITIGSTLRYSNPVAVLKGDVVEVESQGTSIACIATTDATGSSYIARVISTDGNATRTYTYEVEEDGYIAISSRATALKGKVLRKIGKDRLGELENKVSELDNEIETLKNTPNIEVVNNLTEGGAEKALSAEMGKQLNEELLQFGTITEEVVSNDEFVLNPGYLSAYNVGQKATIASDSSLRYSNPMAVLKGDIVEVESKGSGIACIATTDATGSSYIARAISTDGNAIRTYTYEVEEDGYIAISSRAAVLKGKVLRKVRKDRLGELENKVADIDNEIQSTLYKEIIVVSSDMTDLYTQKEGQSYGTVGNKIKIELSNPDWRNIKINSTDGAKSVAIKVPTTSNLPSSVIQYVDSNDIIISLVGTGLKSQQTYEHELSFPEGASAVYVSSLKDNLKVYSQEKVTIKKKVNVIGDAESLKTDSKVIVEAINEVLSVYPTIEEEDMLGKYVISSGQKYGTVGSVIQLASSTYWSHIKIKRADNISFVTVSTLTTSANVSSLVQYVDDNDTVIELAVVKPYTGVVYKHELSFPEGSTAVYVSSLKDNLGAYKIKKLTAPSFVGNPSFRFRVLSWNIGHYAKGNGMSSGITAETYEREKKAFRKVFNSYAADIVGLCEYSSIFYDAESATDAILSQYPYAYIAPTESGYVGTALYSSISLTNREEFSLGGYKAYEGRFVANGKEIVICMAHLPWQSQEQNLEAINTLLSRYEEIPYVVIMGDFNWNTGSEEADAKLFTEAGYQLANWGYLGKILTSYNNVQASNYLDNVAVKGGCILHTEVLQNTPDGKDPDAPVLSDEALWDAVNLSDHFPIICDIVF